MKEFTKEAGDILTDEVFWAEVAILVKRHALASARKLIIEGALAAQSSGVVVDMNAIHAEALVVSRQWSDAWWQQLDQATRAGLREAIIAWETRGLGKRGLPDLVDAIKPLFGPERAQRIAVTEATRLFAEGNKLAVVDDPTIGGLQWQTAEDELVCDICGPLDMKIFPKGQTPPCPAHVNCLLPGNEIVAAGIQEVMRSPYDGPVLDIVSADGHKLSITPNHPILTPRGFVPAEFLHEGDEIIYCPDAQRIASLTDPNAHHRPTPIEQIWSSLLETNSMRSRLMPATPLDFHGDGRFMDGNVEIVGTHSFLQRNLDALFAQHICQYELGRRCFGQSLFARKCSLHLFLKAMQATFTSLMRRLTLRLAMLQIHLLPFQRLGLGLCAGTNALIQQPAPYGASTNPIVFAQGRFRFTRQISRGDLCIRQGLAPLEHGLGGSPESARRQPRLLDMPTESPLRDPKVRAQIGHALASVVALNHCGRDFSANIDPVVIAHRHGQAVKADADALRSDAERGRQLLDRLSEQIATDQIVEIRARHFNGHVYDLQTKDGWYTAGNHYSLSNCRCSLAPSTWRHIRQEPTLPDGSPMWQGGAIPAEAP